MINPRKELENINIYEIPSYPENWDMKLDCNENYFGPSSQVLKAIKEISSECLSQYPYYGNIYDLISSKLNIEKDQFVITNGADEALYSVLNTYLNKNDTVINVSPSFSMPKIYTKLIGANYIEVPYEKKWEYPLSTVKSNLKDNVKALIITTPNNPSGEITDQSIIIEIAKSYPDKLIIIDETYANFSGVTNINLVKDYDNIVVVRSFSKDYALAGLRLGCVISQNNNIDNIKKVLSPYNVNSIAIKAATAAINDDVYFDKMLHELKLAKQYLADEFQKIGALVYPSETNFLLVDFGEHSKLVYNILKANKILVKEYFDNDVIKNCLRITIPTLSASRKLVSLVKTRPTLVFDMDGVLVDVTNSYRSAIKYTYNFFTGKNINDEDIQKLKNAGGYNNDWDLTHQLILQSGFDFSKEKVINVFQSQYWNDGNGSINKEELLINPELLDILSKRYNIAVFTGRPRQEALFTLNKFGIKKYFSSIVTMDDLPLDKQKPDIFGLNVIKDDLITDFLIYFGDTVDDAKCALSSSGTIGIGVLPPNDKSKELEQLLLNSGAMYVIDNINEINNILENIIDEK